MNKSKYQEALNKLYNDSCMYENQKSSIREKDLIQELVDRATPKKVIDINDIEFELYECPSCHCKWISDGKEHYCHNCGQALLWKD